MSRFKLNWFSGVREKKEGWLKQKKKGLNGIDGSLSRALETVDQKPSLPMWQEDDEG